MATLVAISFQCEHLSMFEFFTIFRCVYLLLCQSTLGTGRMPCKVVGISLHCMLSISCAETLGQGWPQQQAMTSIFPTRVDLPNAWYQEFRHLAQRGSKNSDVTVRVFALSLHVLILFDH